MVGTAEPPLPVLQCRWGSGFVFWLFLLAFGLGTVTLAGVKATFLNPFRAVLNALKASWIVKLAAVFAVGVPVSFAQMYSHPVSLSLDISGDYIAYSSYQVRYFSNTNLPGAGLIKRGYNWFDEFVFDWLPDVDLCVSNLVWFEYTQKYFQHSAHAYGRGYRELEICVSGDRLDEVDDDYLMSEYYQVDPRVVITSDDYPNAVWTLESEIRFAVDVHRVDYSDSSDCWVVDGDFSYYILSGDYDFFVDPWIYDSSSPLGSAAFCMDAYRPLPIYSDATLMPNEYSDEMRYIRPTKEYHQSSISFISCPTRLIFRPPNQTFGACFTARIFTCDELDE